MRILVVGSGGREHALCWRLHAGGHEVIAAPGNPGMSGIADCADASIADVDALVATAVGRKPELVVIGPEAPLVAGLADRLRHKGLAVFGPSSAAARLEGSKVFAKEFFHRHGIRTAPFVECRSLDDVDRATAALGERVVVKADGLAAGKGVVVCDRAADAREAARAMLVESRFGAAGRAIVVERRLEGREISVLALCDGARCAVFPPVEDHKTISDGDRGPNTGGMGTVASPAWVTDRILDRVRAEILQPTLAGLAADGIDYRGVLYAGLMVDADGAPWILEYNVRFGDPETQPIMARFAGDLAPWLAGAARGQLPAGDLPIDPQVAVCVVLASRGYPDDPHTGDRITGLDRVPSDVLVFHAGTARVGGHLVAAGGRVLGVTALGASVDLARARAYGAVDQIRFDGMQFRRDIGARGSVHRA